MEHKAGSSFVMKGGTTVTLNGAARVAGEIGIEGGKYLNNNLLLISETGVFRVHQNGEATNSKTGSFYIAGDFVNENLFTNLGADSDGDNSGVPFGVSNDGTMTNHKNITNLGTIKNKGTIMNKEGGVINNERHHPPLQTCALSTTAPVPALDKPTMRTHDSASYNAYFLFPWGTHGNEEPGISHANVHLESDQGWSSVHNNLPNGVLIDAGQGNEEDYAIYGVLIRSRNGHSQIVQTISVEAAPACKPRIPINDVVCSSSSSDPCPSSSDNSHNANRDARPTPSWCVGKHDDCGEAPALEDFENVALQAYSPPSYNGQIVEVMFVTPIRARYVLVKVETWYGHMSMRLGLYSTP
jgi:hypothetical protein